MNILLHTAIALQVFPQMDGSIIKMGTSLWNSVKADQNTCTKLVIEKMLLFEQFERFVPSFFNPELKFFLLAITWDDFGNFSISPKVEAAEPFQFIFGKKNSRRLKGNQLNLLSKPMKGSVNFVAWGMEIEGNSRFEDIDYRKVTKFIETSSFKELLTKAARKKERLAETDLSYQLANLRHNLSRNIPFIAALHPILDFSSQEPKSYSCKNVYGEVCLKTES